MRRNGFTIIELLVVLIIIGVLVMIAKANMGQGHRRYGVARVRSDMRSAATALETYYMDHGSYPAMTLSYRDSVDATIYSKPPELFGRTFRSAGSSKMATLTTPIPYMSSYFPDSLSDVKGAGFRYFTDGDGWILGSMGQDTEHERVGQLMWDAGSLLVPEDTPDDGDPLQRARGDEGVERVYTSKVPQPSVALLAGSGPRGAFTYDPSNGTYSAGDLWRVKQ